MMNTDTVSNARPVVLLIPGMLNTARIWSQVVPHLEALADIRIADVTHQASISDMATDAWRLVADVPDTRRLVVCGFSMGGYVALDLVRSFLLGKRPGPSWSLGLLNTSSRPESAEGLVGREKTIAGIERDFERVIQGIARFGMHPSTLSDSALMKEALSIMRAVGAQTAIRQLRAIMQRADQSSLLPQIAAQVVVMSAGDDLVVPPAVSEEMAALIPGATLAWLSPAGHMTPLEQPVQVANLIKTLL